MPAAIIASTAAVIASSNIHHTGGIPVEIPVTFLKFLFITLLVGLVGGAWCGWREKYYRVERIILYSIVGMATLPSAVSLVCFLGYGIIWLFS